MKLVEDKTDGVFWISFPDFQKYFVSLHICKFHDNFKFSYFKKLESEFGYHLLAINIETQGNRTFAISQRDRSCYPNFPNFKYSSCRFIIVRSKNDKDLLAGVEYIDGKLESFEKNYYIECPNLKKGKYYAFVEFDWEDEVADYEKTFTINSYGVDAAVFSDESDTCHKEEFLKAAFVSKLEKTTQGLHVIDMGD